VAVIVSIFANDTDVPTTGTLVVTQPTNGVVTVNDNGTPNDPSDDIVTYTPNPNYNGVDTFTYTICDGVTPLPNCSTATVTVTVGALVDAVADPVSTPEDVAVIVSIFANDTDVPTTGTLVVTQPTNGVVTVNDNGTPNDPSDDIVTYTPNPNYNGVDTFTYTICDNALPTPNCSTPATVTVTVTPKSLIALNDETYTFASNVGGTIPLFSNDTLNGVPITAGQVTVTIIGNAGINGLVVDPISGVMTIPIGTPEGNYTVIYSIFDPITNQIDQANAIIIIKLNELEINNAFTPNGDGVNEFFEISGIENYPNNTVCIFNRWGVMVYDVSGYNNSDKSFRGISEGRVTISQDSNLPDGTYFYVVKCLDSNGQVEFDKAGYLYLTRQ
jgi:gliding motility-associated-like protein